MKSICANVSEILFKIISLKKHGTYLNGIYKEGKEGVVDFIFRNTFKFSKHQLTIKTRAMFGKSLKLF